MEEKVLSSAKFSPTPISSAIIYHYHKVHVDEKNDLIYERQDENGKIHTLTVCGIRWWDSNDRSVNRDEWEAKGKKTNVSWGWPVYTSRLDLLNQTLLAARLPLVDLTRPHQLSTTVAGGTVQVGDVVYHNNPYQLQYLFDSEDENDNDEEGKNLPSLQFILNFMSNRFLEPYVRIERNNCKASGGLNLIPQPGYYDELFEFDFDKFYLYILRYKDIPYTSFSKKLMHYLCDEMLRLSEKNRKKYKRLYCHFSGSLKNFDFDAYQAMTSNGRKILTDVADRVRKETKCTLVAGLTDCLRVFVPWKLRDQENTQFHLVDSIFKSTGMRYKWKKISHYVATPSCRKVLYSQYKIKELKKICTSLFQSAIAAAICLEDSQTDILSQLIDSQSRFQPFLFAKHRHGVKEKDIDFRISDEFGIGNERVEFLVLNPANDKFVEVLTAHILGISFEVDASFDRDGLEGLKQLSPSKETHVIHSYLYYEKLVNESFDKIEFMVKSMSCEKRGCSDSQRRYETRYTKDAGKELMLNEIYLMAKRLAKELGVFRGSSANVPEDHFIFHKSMIENFETWALDTKKLPSFWDDRILFLKYCHLFSLIRQIRITETKRVNHKKFFIVK